LTRLRFIASAAILVGFTAGLGFVRAATGAPQSTATPDPAPQAATPPNTIRVATKLISVNVIVRDKHGQPVTDLTKDDFVLLDGKKQQSIQIFSMEKTELEPQPTHSLPPDTYSNEIGGGDGTPSNLTIILLDSLNTAAFDRAYPRGQVRKLLLTLQPQDRVALYSLGAHLRVLHDFTSDASALLAALKESKDYELLNVDVPHPAAANAVNHQLEPLADENLAVQSEQLVQNRAAATAEALRTIADHVSYLPGRKNLLWISAEFPFYLESNNLQRSPEGKKLAYPTEGEMVERALNNANIAVYPIDARGLVAGGIDEIANKSPDKLAADLAETSNMEMLARRTGGRAYRDNNGIAGSIRQTIDGSRVTYQLGFYPEDVTWDGSFHKLQVKVDRHDLQVQARDGYFALAQPNLTRDMVRELIYQAAHSPIDATGIRFTLHVAPLSPTPVSPTAENKLRLSFSLAPAQFAFAVQNSELKDSVDIAFITMDATNHALQTTVLPLPFNIDAQTYQHLLQTGLPLTRDVVIPPNASQMRVIVFDEGNGQVGSVLVPLTSYLSKTKD
jgi:VWFA-related protein